MKAPLMLGLLLSLGAITACKDHPATDEVGITDDAEYSERIVGTWESLSKPGDKLISTSIFRPDGTGAEYIVSRDNPQGRGILVTMKWSIKDGLLSLETIESENPQAVPVGLKLQNRILSLTDERIECELTEGYGDGLPKTSTSIRKSHSVELPVKETGPIMAPMKKDWLPDGMKRAGD